MSRGKGGRDGNGDYTVGYGKPPEEHRFKKGRSGNPGGRPKGKKYVNALEKVMNQTVTLPINGVPQRMTYKDALWHRMGESLTRLPAPQLFKIMREMEAFIRQAAELSEDDRLTDEVLQRAARSSVFVAALAEAGVVSLQGDDLIVDREALAQVARGGSKPGLEEETAKLVAHYFGS